MDKPATITIEATTKDRLDAIGRRRETFDKLINRLLDERDRKEEKTREREKIGGDI